MSKLDSVWLAITLVIQYQIFIGFSFLTINSTFPYGWNQAASGHSCKICSLASVYEAFHFGNGLLRFWPQIYVNGHTLTSVASSAKSRLWQKCLQDWINSYIIFIQPSEFKQCRLKIYWRRNILHHKPDNLNNKKPIKHCITIW